MKEDTDSKKWFNVEYVPKDYIFPKEERPENLDTPVCDSIPAIDLSNSNSFEAILMASQELGFFQVLFGN